MMDGPIKPPDHQFWAEIAWVALAIVGGVARYLDTYLRSGEAPKAGMMIANGVVSGFSGYMVAQVALKVQPDWALVAAGIGGYLGTQGLDWLAGVVKNRIGGKDNP